MVGKVEYEMTYRSVHGGRKISATDVVLEFILDDCRGGTIGRCMETELCAIRSLKRYLQRYINAVIDEYISMWI
jgi:hypothetical protein